MRTTKLSASLTAAKIFAVILLVHFVAPQSVRTRSMRRHFRQTDYDYQIFTLCRILEHRHKFKQSTTASFIHLHASLDVQSFRNIFWFNWMSEKYVTLLAAHYSPTQMRVRAYGEEYLEIPLDFGVRPSRPSITGLVQLRQRLDTASYTQ